MLKTTHQFGLDNELKFNPNKTQFMVFNSKKNEKINIKFGDINIEQIHKIKYLGVNVTDDMKNNEHLKSKLTAELMRLQSLKKCGYGSDKLDSKIIINQFKSYIRPTLTYGFENSTLNLTQLKDTQSHESTLLKRGFNLANRGIKSTELLIACNIETTKVKLLKTKYSFINRIKENNFTNEIIKEILSSDSLISNDRLSIIGHLMNMVDSKEACLDTLMLNILIEIEIETSETSNKANKTTTQIVRSGKVKVEKQDSRNYTQRWQHMTEKNTSNQ